MTRMTLTSILAAPSVTGVNADYFSVRWTGYLVPRCTAAYTFYVTSGMKQHISHLSFLTSIRCHRLCPYQIFFLIDSSLLDDGDRLSVNGQSLVTNWAPHGPVEDTGIISLTANQLYNITLEYFEDAYGAQVFLYPHSSPLTSLTLSTPYSSVFQVFLSWSSSCEAKAIIPQTQLYSK